MGAFFLRVLVWQCARTRWPYCRRYALLTCTDFAALDTAGLRHDVTVYSIRLNYDLHVLHLLTLTVRLPPKHTEAKVVIIRPEIPPETIAPTHGSSTNVNLN